MQKPDFLIVGSGYNCVEYIDDCVRSVTGQLDHSGFSAVFIDDCSTDGTHKRLQRVLPEAMTIRMPRRMGTVRARHTALEHLQLRGTDLSNTVIVWLDLDDQLMCNAIGVLQGEYERNPDTWLTYGNYRTKGGFLDPGTVPFENPAIPDSALRSYGGIRHYDFRFMHLRSYHYKLYEKLTYEDLYPFGESYPYIYPDANLLLCMQELAGADHMRAIAEPLYIYNMRNPRSIHHQFTPDQRAHEYEMYRKLTPKQPLLAL